VQVVRGEDFSLKKELDYITQAASRGDGRIVTVGALVLFSTCDGDAWVLDVEDNLALCLMREFDRRDPEIHETATNFSIRWDSTFRFESGCLLVTSQSGRVTAYPGFLSETFNGRSRRPGKPLGATGVPWPVGSTTNRGTNLQAMKGEGVGSSGT
jgi:hypothetical protein